ncbi:MAG: coiled-coil domain-containing protein, partial [Actinomycetota bacterium]
MTNRLKRFPASFRFVAVTFALVATASLATRAAAGPPSAEQVQNAKDRVAQLVRDAHVAQRQLDAINIRANEVAAEYDRELGRLEKLNAELLHTQLTLAQARARYDAIVAQLNERARTMFMQGPASDLEFLLGASSFSDLTDRLEYVNVVASNDADLATEVQNTKNVLSAKE